MIKKLAIILIVLLAGIAIGRYSVVYSRKMIAKPVPAYDYKTNRAYMFITEYDKMYKQKSKIVMFGNSFMATIQWNEFLNRTDIANRGMNGDITAGMVERLQSVVDCEPELCFIEGGINDINHHLPYDNYIKNIVIIIDNLQAHHIKPVFFSLLHTTDACEEADYVNEQVIVFNKGLDSIAAAKNVQVINLNNRLSRENRLLREYALKDGVHLTVKGYEIWKEEMLKYLN